MLYDLPIYQCVQKLVCYPDNHFVDMTHAISKANTLDMKQEQNNSLLKSKITKPQVNFHCSYMKKEFFSTRMLYLKGSSTNICYIALFLLQMIDF